ncbi:reverse transcriptase-like protein [Candidatus Dojkabacteria bacterium]|uniref:Reverse transcriptase-like protein n=1 Tax=Candidatus Dojkabacteria bacterium TaxID=2099670 RepID=A0A3M0YZX0_9BACT|nr:MAG: reverse transcriptase-like protein [Candidatus Dojkabacteria bacterium]
MFRLFSDGGSRGNPGESACSFLVFDDEENLVAFDAKYLGIQTNNYSEYIGLIEGLKFLKKQDIKQVRCFLDSELVVNQINKVYKVSNPKIKKLFEQVEILILEFDEISFNHVSRDENKFADRLVNIILDATNRKSQPTSQL